MISPEDQANVISFGISILFFGFALAIVIDDIKEYLVEKLRKKYRKEI